MVKEKPSLRVPIAAILGTVTFLLICVENPNREVKILISLKSVAKKGVGAKRPPS